MKYYLYCNERLMDEKETEEEIMDEMMACEDLFDLLEFTLLDNGNREFNSFDGIVENPMDYCITTEAGLEYKGPTCGMGLF